VATGARGFGAVSSLPAVVISELAEAAEACGYRTFWTNHTPDGDGLDAIGVAADATTSLRLGVGVVPLDRVPPEPLAARIAGLDLPMRRVVIGVGAGAAPGAPARVRHAVDVVRAATGAAVAIGALGPRMAHLAGEVADGVLLDWPTPGSAVTTLAHVRRGARAADRPQPPVAGYVFTALGAAGRRQLRAEAAHYAALPAYTAHFRRAAVEAIDAAIQAETPQQVRQALAPFDAVLDETIVRAVVGEPGAAAYRRVLEAAAPPSRARSGRQA
jgi:alkanesulfonate monooxygenase SsuD/methylene tetrahydromethanopterin reductase-like flavin-dependent oxidoreductase (luciferase family)